MPISHIKGIFVNPKFSLNVAHLGQVFTPQNIVADMLKLVRSVERVKNPRFLEPSCGNGAFFAHLPSNKIGIEIDSSHCPPSHQMCHNEQSKVSQQNNNAKRYFANAQYDKENIDCHEKKIFNCISGQIIFTRKRYEIPFNALFFVKVGAVSGADSIFANEKFGNMDFVCSFSAKTGKTKKMIYGDFGKNCAYLAEFKSQLKARKIKKFDEHNWWEWGRDYYKSKSPRIYVNSKTRNKKPFFLHHCNAYDGSVLAIFPRFEVDNATLQKICEMLNNVDWEELGFVCDGRFLFSQRSLENCLLGSEFGEVYETLTIKAIS